MIVPASLLVRAVVLPFAAGWFGIGMSRTTAGWPSDAVLEAARDAGPIEWPELSPVDTLLPEGPLDPWHGVNLLVDTVVESYEQGVRSFATVRTGGAMMEMRPGDAPTLERLASGAIITRGDDLDGKIPTETVRWYGNVGEFIVDRGDNCWKIIATDRIQMLIERPAGSPRGLVIVCTGLDLGANDAKLRENFVRSGLTVITVIPRWKRLADVAAFTPHAPSADHPERDAILARIVGSKFAEVADREIAATAFAVEDVLTRELGLSPELARAPIAVLGLSAGSQTMPAVALRVEEVTGQPVRALVTVGGGADFLSLANDSFIGRNFISWYDHNAERLPDDTIEAIINRFRRSSRLDPDDLMPSLLGTPVLCIEASRDGFVPNEYNGLLWERAGRPERWVYRGGHAALFWRLGLGWIDDRVADWVTSRMFD